MTPNPKPQTPDEMYNAYQAYMQNIRDDMGKAHNLAKNDADFLRLVDSLTYDRDHPQQTAQTGAKPKQSGWISKGALLAIAFVLLVVVPACYWLAQGIGG